MKIAVVTNGYPVGKSHMVSILKQAGHDVVFIDIEALPVQGQNFEAVFVDEVDMTKALRPDEYELVCFEYHPPLDGYKITQNRLRSLDSYCKVRRERKPRPYFRKGERW